jgi:hypothetical protein
MHIAQHSDLAHKRTYSFRKEKNMKNEFYDYCVYLNIRWELFPNSSSEKWVVAFNCTQFKMVWILENAQLLLI